MTNASTKVCVRKKRWGGGGVGQAVGVGSGYLSTILLTRRISSYNNKQTTNASLASINTNFVRENMHHGILS